MMFLHIRSKELGELILSSPLKSHELDSLLLHLAQEIADNVHFYDSLHSLTAGRHSTEFPTVLHSFYSSLKHKVLDLSEMDNYQSMSNVTFLSKIIEKLLGRLLSNTVCTF